MASKEDLHTLIDQLPDAEVHAAQRFLEYLCKLGDPVARAFRNAPEADEPLSDEEAKAADEAWEQYQRGEGRPWDDVRKELKP